MAFLATALFAVYAVYFTDWFKPKILLVSHTYRNLHPGPARAGVLRPLIFGLNRPTPLTEISVVPFDAYQTNKNVPTLWHLVTDSNSVPTKTFFYGEYIRGMKPAIKGTHAEDLETNVPYLIILHSWRLKGEHKFELTH